MNLQKLIELIAEQAAREVIASTRRLQGAVWMVLRSHPSSGNEIELALMQEPLLA